MFKKEIASDNTDDDDDENDHNSFCTFCCCVEQFAACSYLFTPLYALVCEDVLCYMKLPSDDDELYDALQHLCLTQGRKKRRKILTLSSLCFVWDGIVLFLLNMTMAFVPPSKN